MIDSREIIEHDCTPEQWGDFERKVQMLEPTELADIADRLSLRIDPEEPWQTFRDEFGRQTWWDFTEAYEHVMCEPY
jgi:hypothetical protein